MRIAALAFALLFAQAQAPAPQPPARPIPLAANTLAANLPRFAGQIVSVNASVDRQLSPTAFVVSQRGSDRQVLVLVPSLSEPLAPGARVTVVGEAVAFDATEVARRAGAPGLPADVAARYQGQPAIVATAVVTPAMNDLAKRVPPPMTPAEEKFDAVMKRVGPAFNELRTAATASNAPAAASSAKTLKSAFSEADAFWKSLGKADAIDWNRTAGAHLTVLQRAIGAGNWDQVKTSIADVNRMCSTCHTAYRERFDDGTYRVRSTR